MRRLLRAVPTAPARHALLLLTLVLTALPRGARAEWPRGEVISPATLFQRRHALDRVVLESNPRVYLHRDFNPNADLILVVGMPGLGSRSENFIGCLHHGLRGPALTRRLVLATIQDPATRGPRFQGQSDRAHANVWQLDSVGVAVLRRFIERLAAELGHLRVYFVGYSTGSAAAPLAASRVARLGPSPGFVVEGSVSLGTGTAVGAAQLRSHKLRSLFLVAPPRRPRERRASRFDQGNRRDAEADVARLVEGGANVQLRHIESARRHTDWHWGLMSQCRYLRRDQHDRGRGAWPNYWMPNPETYGFISAFLAGRPVPWTLSPPPTRCPHPPNVHDPRDPDAKVDDPSRQSGPG